MGRGGAERVISIVSKNLSEDYQSDICLLLSNKVDYLLDDSTHIIDMTNKSSNLVAKSLKWIVSLNHYVKKENPDIIVAMSTKEFLLAKIAAFGKKCSIVVSERNDPNCDGRGKLTDLLTSIFYPRAACIIFQTGRAQSYFNQKIKNNSVIIPNPVKVQVQSMHSKSKRIVSIGRLEPQKNQKMLLDAFSRLVKNYPDYKLTIYGEGGLRKTLEDQIHELGIEGSVSLPGEVSDIHEKIADAEMFVLSSDREGLSNALLEALAMGLPCISTNCAGAEECIENGKSGLIVPVGNVDALFAAMDRYIEEPLFREQCAIEGQKRSDRFRVENVIKQWKKAFDRI
jgi:glycosyltransferase involved in cell wall biosynthesis